MSAENDINKQAKLTRFLTGKVVSDKMDKSIVVLVVFRKKHPVGKYITLSTKVHAHDADNTCTMGDTVVIKESRPYSKKKRWELERIVEKA